jgi:hypothetical protein
VLDLLHSAVAAGRVYAVLCSGWGRSSSLGILAWYLEATPIVSVTRTLSSMFFSNGGNDLVHQSPSCVKASTPGASTGLAAGKPYPSQLSLCVSSPRHLRLVQNSDGTQCALAQFTAGYALVIQVRYYLPVYILSSNRRHRAPANRHCLGCINRSYQRAQS